MRIYKNLTVIAAVARKPADREVGSSHDYIIGDRNTNKLPWRARIPGDLKWFKQWTRGGWLVVGRKTWESFPAVLPDRRFIVVSSDPANVKPIKGCEIRESRRVFTDSGKHIGQVVSHPQDALHLVSADEELFVAGGGQIYQRLLPHAHTMILTQVEADRYLKEGIDPVYFPQVNFHEVWQQESLWCPDEDPDVQMVVWRRRGQ